MAWFSWIRAVVYRARRSNHVPRCQYNGLGEQIAALEYNSVSDDWTWTDYYYNGSWQVVEERRAAGLSGRAGSGVGRDGCTNQDGTTSTARAASKRRSRSGKVPNQSGSSNVDPCREFH